MSALEELEKIAVRHAQEAVTLDRQGKKEQAIAAYKRAIDCLLKLVHAYPNHNLNRFFIQRAQTYKMRIRLLQDIWVDSRSSEEDVTSYGPEQKSPKDQIEELILRDPPNVHWDEIVGLEDAKRAIKQTVVYPSLRPDLFPLGWPRGILLFGPPGCGKTLLAAAVANEINATFILIDAASIMSKWLGEAERNVARVFKAARERAKELPSIIFIDEVDSLMGMHRLEVGGETRVRNQFLKEMDGIIDKKKFIHVYVIGSTNKPWTLDDPFIRRFQKRIYVPPPGFHERLGIFKLYTRCLKLSSDVNLEELARLTEGFSGSDILDVCQSVQLKVNSELFESGKINKSSLPRKIAMQDFLEVLESRKPSVSKTSLEMYERWFSKFKAL
ncbi:TPA: AAA family ATPase [Candidatus Bathyarchaeota archaeon]|nr:AAA family ATPase [Candidatus Bathyarchaeota archaeon]